MGDQMGSSIGREITVTGVRMTGIWVWLVLGGLDSMMYDLVEILHRPKVISYHSHAIAYLQKISYQHDVFEK